MEAATTILRPRRGLVPVLGAARALRHRGVAVHCPCCEGSFGTFLAHDGRAGASCPRCGSLPRQRLLWLFLAERTKILSKRMHLLQLAPDYALERRLRRLPGLDHVSAGPDVPPWRLPFETCGFDAVIAGPLADDRGIAEVRRVLRPGGWAVVAPSREPGPDFAERVADAGFAVRRDSYLDRLDEATVRRCGLAGTLDGDIYFCLKPGARMRRWVPA